MTTSIHSSTMGLPGLIRKKNPNTVVGGGNGLVWNPALGRWTGTRLAPRYGPGGESRLFKMVNGVRVEGSEVVATEEKLADSKPVSTNDTGTKTSSTPAGVSSEVNTATTGTSAGSVLASIKSGLMNFMPAILVIGAVIIGIIVIKSAGNK